MVSLVPSLTETLFDLGVGNTVVGVTDFCIFPAEIACERVGGTKNPGIDRIRELRPDLVHMNMEENLRRHAEQIETFAPVFVTEPKTVADVRALFHRLGGLHDAAGRAGDLTARLDAEVTAMPVRRFTFACAIWKKPWMWCGGDTYVSSLIESAGGENVLRHRQRYPETTLDCLASLEPQIVFLPDEPYVFSPADAEEAGPALGARIVGPFPGHLFTWHGSRTIAGLRFLKELLEQDQTSSR